MNNDPELKAAAHRCRPHSDPACRHTTRGALSTNPTDCTLCPGCGAEYTHVVGVMTACDGVATYVSFAGEVQTAQAGSSDPLLINGHRVPPEALGHARESDRPHAFVIGDCELCGVTFALRFLDYKGAVYSDALLIRTAVEVARDA